MPKILNPSPHPGRKQPFCDLAKNNDKVLWGYFGSNPTTPIAMCWVRPLIENLGIKLIISSNYFLGLNNTFGKDLFDNEEEKWLVKMEIKDNPYPRKHFLEEYLCGFDFDLVKPKYTGKLVVEEGGEGWWNAMQGHTVKISRKGNEFLEKLSDRIIFN